MYFTQMRVIVVGITNPSLVSILTGLCLYLRLFTCILARYTYLCLLFDFECFVFLACVAQHLAQYLKYSKLVEWMVIAITTASD